MNIEKLYTQWSEDNYFDESTRNELLALKGNDGEIRERFYTELAFGTAGIRGVLGAGTNRMNIYVVRRVSFGIAQLLKNKGEAACKAGVVIAYDSRNMSVEFAKEAAAQYAGNGIKVYLHQDVAPVPILSYSVRYLKTAAGVMVTASHNPKEYNGYKAYGDDGAQLSVEDSNEVLATIEKITDYTTLPVYDFDVLKDSGMIEIVGKEIYDSYTETIKKLIADPETLKETAGKLKLVYTPVHGAGAAFVPNLLKDLGFTELKCVEPQMIHDGNFPTVPVPNPEDKGVYTLAIEIAEKEQANLILASDPDADRTGVAVRDKNGEYVLLTGNQIGILLLNYILKGKSRSGALKGNEFVVSTIVSTRMTADICKAYNISYKDVLTGFKYIGEQITLREEQGPEKYLFAFEESYGYLMGSHARDKDAVSACMAVAETAAYYGLRGMTLLDALDEIYQEFGYWAESQKSFNFKGEAGAGKMKALMADFREKKETIMPEGTVIKFTDYKEGPSVTGLPVSDVLYYNMGDSWLCIRPSGTEPKVKLYFGAKGNNMDEAVKKMNDLREIMIKMIEG